MAKLVTAMRKMSPICQNRTLKERLKLQNGHTWAEGGAGLYGTRVRRCSWCGTEQYKHRMFRRWVTIQ